MAYERMTSWLRGIGNAVTSPAETPPAETEMKDLLVPERDVMRMVPLSSKEGLGKPAPRDSPDAEDFYGSLTDDSLSDTALGDEEDKPREPSDYSMKDVPANDALKHLASHLEGKSQFKILDNGTILNPDNKEIGSMKNGIISMAPGTIDEHIQMLKDAGIREVKVLPANDPRSIDIERHMNKALGTVTRAPSVFGQVSRQSQDADALSTSRTPASPTPTPSIDSAIAPSVAGAQAIPSPPSPSVPSLTRTVSSRSSARSR